MKRQDTRELILQVAEMLIRKKGYNSFSYHDIALALNIKNAAIHYHFPTKEVLGLEVIRENISRFHQFQKQVAGMPEEKQLAEFIKTYTASCRAGNVCLVGAISVEYFGLPPKLTEVMKGMASVISDWVTELLSAGREKKIFQFRQQPSQKALMIITNLAAGVQLARFMGADAYHSIVDGIVKELHIAADSLDIDQTR